MLCQMTGNRANQLFIILSEFKDEMQRFDSEQEKCQPRTTVQYNMNSFVIVKYIHIRE